jgi:non-homologous end joining protein Ku
MDGPRFFDNKTGDQVDYMDIVKHYEKETGNDVWDLMK